MIARRIAEASMSLALLAGAAGCTENTPPDDVIAQRASEGYVEPHDGEVVLTKENRCAWSPQEPMPQPPGSSRIIDIRCGFPLNVDGFPLSDRLDVFGEPDRIRSVAVVKTGAVVTLLCITMGETVTDALNRSSRLWGKIDIPATLDPNKKAHVGYLPANAFGYALSEKPC